MYLPISQASRRREIEAAEKKLLECKSEESALRYLLDSKPAYLKCGFEQWIDNKYLKDDFKKLKTKLKIHGYEDRAERMHYLYTTLATKWEAKPTSFKSLMKFLMELSKRPTEVLYLTLGTEIYTNEPEVMEEKDDDPQEQLKQSLLEELREDYVDVYYSSDSDLSDWQLSDTEPEEIESLEEKPKLRHSNTFPTFQRPDYFKLKALKDAEDAKRDFQMYWNQEEANAERFIKRNIRKVELIALKNQPVISSLVSMHSKFGEFWEWKKRGPPLRSPRFTILEDDVVTELLWLFATPNPSGSIVFTPDWIPKSEILLSSTTLSSYTSFMTLYGNILKKLETLVQFRTQIETTDNSKIVPKVYNAYAQCLSEIFTYISCRMDEIHRNRKIKNSKSNEYKESCLQPCTTLVQLNFQLKDIFSAVTVVTWLHQNGASNILDEVSAQPKWFTALKLISTLEMNLIMETKASLYGQALFLFAKTLVGYLDELIRPLETLVWEEDSYLFRRDPNVKLNDSNFWDKSITTQPIQEKFIKDNNQISPLSCLNALLPKMLAMLKILEMLRLLEEDFRVVLGRLPTPQEIVTEFLNEFVGVIQSEEETKVVEIEPVATPDGPDYCAHFKFLGLEGSFVVDSFKYMLDKEFVSSRSTRLCSSQEQGRKNSIMCLERFLKIEKLPIKICGNVLSEVLTRTLDPYFKATQCSLKAILREHRVDETIVLLREIILGGREDFAKDLIKLANTVEAHEFGDVKCKDGHFQALLEKYYPDGRSNVDIQFLLDNTTSLCFKIIVAPHFPLNLVLSPKCINACLFVSRRLHRLRKSLWALNSLALKDCRVIETVEPNRMYMVRFALIHLCSSLLSYFLEKVFSKDLSISTYDDSESLDCLLKAQENFLCGSEGEILQNQALDKIVIGHLVSMSSSMCKYWSKGISLMTIIRMQDTLKKCWLFLGDYNSGHHSREYKELAYHVGTAPKYL